MRVSKSQSQSWVKGTSNGSLGRANDGSRGEYEEGVADSMRQTRPRRCGEIIMRGALHLHGPKRVLHRAGGWRRRTSMNENNFSTRTGPAAAAALAAAAG